MRRVVRTALAATALAAGLAWPVTARAATPPATATMTIEAGPSLVPAAVTVRTGGSVVFRNATTLTYQVQVGTGYLIVLLPGQSADGGTDPPPFSPTSPGSYAVTASRPEAAAATGTIDAVTPTTASPAPPPAPASSASPRPTRTAAPAPAPASSPASRRPSSAPAARRRTGGKGQTGALPSLPPFITPIPGAGQTIPPPSGAPPLVAGGSGGGSGGSGAGLAAGGPLQSLGLVGGGVALPAAVALVLLLGIAGALARVLLAEAPR